MHCGGPRWRLSCWWTPLPRPGPQPWEPGGTRNPTAGGGHSQGHRDLAVTGARPRLLSGTPQSTAAPSVYVMKSSPPPASACPFSFPAVGPQGSEDQGSAQGPWPLYRPWQTFSLTVCLCVVFRQVSAFTRLHCCLFAEGVRISLHGFCVCALKADNTVWQITGSRQRTYIQILAPSPGPLILGEVA